MIKSWICLKGIAKAQSEILDLKNVTATGRVAYDTGLYVLDYQLAYTIVLASSRSMEPVELQESYPVTEVFAEDVQSDADIEAPRGRLDPSNRRWED